jgi:uncharacterized protein YneF (UPF0154 family)
MNKKTLTIIAIILALLFLFTLGWGISRNSAAGELQEANVEINQEVDQLQLCGTTCSLK